MADENDSRTASVGKKRPFNGESDEATAKRSRMSPADDYVALDSSAESGEIISKDEEVSPADSSRLYSPSGQPSTLPVDPSEEQLAQIRAAQERILKRLTVYGPKGGSDATPKESKMTTKLKKMKNRVMAISVIAPNAQHMYGQDHVRRLSEALLQWVGSHPSLLSHVHGLLMLTPDAWSTLRPNAHKSHILLRMDGPDIIDELLPAISYSSCPIVGAQAALLDAFKINTMPSSADLSQTYRLTWADEALQQILTGRVKRIVDDLKAGKITLQDCLADDQEAVNSNMIPGSGASSVSKPSTVAHTPNASLTVESDTLSSPPPPPSPPPLKDTDLEANEAPPLPEGPPPVLLSDLSPDLRALQYRYWPHLSDHSLAICEICSTPGHSSLTCPNRTCIHCSLDFASPEGHFSCACPEIVHCRRCTQRGHNVATCTSKLAATADEIAAIPCENCLLPGHELRECEWLWRTYTPQISRQGSAIPKQLETGISISRRNAEPPPKVALLRHCYNCAKDSHLGDDCPLLPLKDGPRQQFRVFSAEWSNLFALNPYTPASPRPSGGGSVPQQNSHIIFTDDTDDEDDSMDLSDDFTSSGPPNQSRPPSGTESARRKKLNKGKAKQEPAYTFQGGKSGADKSHSGMNKKQDIKFSKGPDSFMAQSRGQAHRGLNATGLPPKPPPRSENKGSLESRITGGGLSGDRGRGGGNRSRGGGRGGGGRGRGGGYNAVPAPRWA